MRLIPLTPTQIITVLSRILIGSAIFYFISRTYVDPDLFWHLKCGLDTWLSKVITVHDPYSFLTFQSHWIDEEWLFEIIVAQLYFHYGWLGLILFKSFLSFSIVASIYYFLRIQKADGLSQGIFLLLTLIFLGPSTNVIRPQIISYLFLTLLLLLLDNFPLHKRRLFLLPFIFLLWVNCHGGFIVGLLTLLAYTVIYAVLNRSQRTNCIWLASITLICWLVSLVNPYGPELPLQIAKFCITPHPDITEWQPMKLASLQGITWLTVTVLGIISLSTCKGKNPGRALLWLPFVAAPLVSVRHIPFFGIATIFLMGENLSLTWKNLGQRKSSQKKWGSLDTALALVTMAVPVGLILLALQFYVKPQMVVDQDVPRSAMGLLKRVGFKGNLLINYDWGSYAIWHLYPDIKVSFDGRREFAYSPEATLANTVFTSGEGPWDYILNHFRVDGILTRTDMAAYNLMKLKAGWVMAYSDQTATIFLPTNSPKLIAAKQVLSAIQADKQTEQLSLPLF